MAPPVHTAALKAALVYAGTTLVTLTMTVLWGPGLAELVSALLVGLGPAAAVVVDERLRNAPRS